MVRLEGVRHAYRGAAAAVQVIERVDLSVHAREFVALIGPSGCGKSTILNLVAGVFPPEGGRVWYGGKPLTGVNTAVGYATQRDTLLPWRSVVANVELPLEIRGVTARERAERAWAALRKVGLAGFERCYPHQLSGGMRRRALIARTLIYEPETLLLDEPFGGLDVQNKLLLQNQLLGLWQDLRETVLFVTHDLDEAIALADRVVVFTARPCRIKLELPVEIPRPRDVVAIRQLPAYQVAHRELWNALREEVASLP